MEIISIYSMKIKFSDEKIFLTEDENELQSNSWDEDFNSKPSVEKKKDENRFDKKQSKNNSKLPEKSDAEYTPNESDKANEEIEESENNKFGENSDELESYCYNSEQDIEKQEYSRKKDLQNALNKNLISCPNCSKKINVNDKEKLEEDMIQEEKLSFNNIQCSCGQIFTEEQLKKMILKCCYCPKSEIIISHTEKNIKQTAVNHFLEKHSFKLKNKDKIGVCEKCMFIYANLKSHLKTQQHINDDTNVEPCYLFNKNKQLYKNDSVNSKIACPLCEKTWDKWDITEISEHLCKGEHYEQQKSKDRQKRIVVCNDCKKIYYNWKKFYYAHKKPTVSKEYHNHKHKIWSKLENQEIKPSTKNIKCPYCPQFINCYDKDYKLIYDHIKKHEKCPKRTNRFGICFNKNCKKFCCVLSKIKDHCYRLGCEKYVLFEKTNENINKDLDEEDYHKIDCPLCYQKFNKWDCIEIVSHIFTEHKEDQNHKKYGDKVAVCNTCERIYQKQDSKAYRHCRDNNHKVFTSKHLKILSISKGEKASPEKIRCCYCYRFICLKDNPNDYSLVVHHISNECEKKNENKNLKPIGICLVEECKDYCNVIGNIKKHNNINNHMGKQQEIFLYKLNVKNEIVMDEKNISCCFCNDIIPFELFCIADHIYDKHYKEQILIKEPCNRMAVCLFCKRFYKKYSISDVNTYCLKNHPESIYTFGRLSKELARIRKIEHESQLACIYCLESFKELKYINFTRNNIDNQEQFFEIIKHLEDFHSQVAFSRDAGICLNCGMVKRLDLKHIFCNKNRDLNYKSFLNIKLKEKKASKGEDRSVKCPICNTIWEDWDCSKITKHIFTNHYKNQVGKPYENRISLCKTCKIIHKKNSSMYFSCLEQKHDILIYRDLENRYRMPTLNEISEDSLGKEKIHCERQFSKKKSNKMIKKQSEFENIFLNKNGFTCFACRCFIAFSGESDEKKSSAICNNICEHIRFCYPLNVNDNKSKSGVCLNPACNEIYENISSLECLNNKNMSETYSLDTFCSIFGDPEMDYIHNFSNKNDFMEEEQFEKNDTEKIKCNDCFKAGKECFINCENKDYSNILAHWKSNHYGDKKYKQWGICLNPPCRRVYPNLDTHVSKGDCTGPYVFNQDFVKNFVKKKKKTPNKKANIFKEELEIKCFCGQSIKYENENLSNCFMHVYTSSECCCYDDKNKLDTYAVCLHKDCMELIENIELHHFEDHPIFTLKEIWTKHYEELKILTMNEQEQKFLKTFHKNPKEVYSDSIWNSSDDS
jgi:hypothetical protein